MLKKWKSPIRKVPSVDMKLVAQSYFEALWDTCTLVATPPVWTALLGHDQDRRPNIGTVPVKTGRLAIMHDGTHTRLLKGIHWIHAQDLGSIKVLNFLLVTS